MRGSFPIRFAQGQDDGKNRQQVQKRNAGVPPLRRQSAPPPVGMTEVGVVRAGHLGCHLFFGARVGENDSGPHRKQSMRCRWAKRDSEVME
jgi:hypothetical protein